ncbi:MAG: hypothetical protein ABSG64_13440 [Solirubrobacteraceae bacterium]
MASIAASACGGTSVAGYASRVDSRAVTDLVFQARASTTAQVNSSTLGAAVKIMRSRLGDLGVGGATVTESGGDEIVVRLPNVKNAAEVASVLGAGGQLYFYDWEESVIGPNGQPAGPNNGASTGDDPTDQGGDPGTSVNALSEYQAIERAAKRPAMHLKLMSAPYGTLYYVDPATQKVLTLSEAIVPAPGNAAARQQAVGYLNADIADAGNKLPAGAKLVYIKPGTVVRQALTPNDTSDPGYNYYYVLQDDPVISGEDITNPIEQIDPTSAQPVVAFGFKGPAIRPFEALTAQLARRGSENSTGNNHNFQHFAITLDNQIVSVPYVDYTQYPSGVDANEGGEIAGDFTIASARALAAVLASGQLPLQLYEIPSTHS